MTCEDQARRMARGEPLRRGAARAADRRVPGRFPEAARDTEAGRAADPRRASAPAQLVLIREAGP